MDSFGTGTLPDDRLEEIVREVFDLRPRCIIDALRLKRPIYGKTAAYGHFGRKAEAGTYVTREPDAKDIAVDFFPWERTDRVSDLQSAAR